MSLTGGGTHGVRVYEGSAPAVFCRTGYGSGLVDLQAALLEEAILASFVSGFQLALGIAGELKPYSFARDEEARAEERGNCHGEAQS